MDLTRHCELCDHQEKDLKIGTTCGLNHKKPEFNKTCIKIQLRDKFEDKLKSVNIDYEIVKKKKVITHSYFVLFILIGIAVIIGGFLLGKYAFEGGVISTVPIIIMGVGLAPLTMAFGTLNNYIQELDVAKTKKEKIDEVLNAYGIEYELDIKYGEEFHGTQEIYTELKTKGIR